MMKRYFALPGINPQYLKKQEYFLLFESSLCDRDNFKSFIFLDPVEIIQVKDFSRVPEAFRRIEEYSARHYIAGYFSYELGYYFENEVFKAPLRYPFPLIQLCVFDKVITFNHKTGKTDVGLPGLFLAKEKEPYLNGRQPYLNGRQPYRLDNLRLNFKEPQYVKKIARIKDYIRKGFAYQVNLTGKYSFDFSGSALSFYQDLRLNQNTPYGAFCKFRDEYVISLSPELYFRRNKNKIYSRPMKGTVARGRDIAQDKQRAVQLAKSAKDAAENLMIVDLIRNDLGRLCGVSSVRVDKLFTIERYNTVFQMTSTVSGILKKKTTYFDIFRHFFPGGSVTGAPKISSMRIIRELEEKSRKVYCGALGLIKPKAEAVFNLPIRTVYLSGNKAQMGVGSGIVIDSLADKEFQECVLKARFLTQRIEEFRLIETLLWEKGYTFLKEHLRRMQNSAQYFNFYFSHREAALALKGIERRLLRKKRYKVRLLLGKDGNFTTEYSLLADGSSHKERLVALSRERIDPAGIWLYHKSTNRALYESEYAYYRQKGYYEVVFLNTRNEFTEGSFSNIIIQSGARFYTPPLSCGLLPGIFRAYLLKNKQAQEKIIGWRELERAERIYLCNSVRGMVEVKLEPKEKGRSDVYPRGII